MAFLYRLLCTSIELWRPLCLLSIVGNTAICSSGFYLSIYSTAGALAQVEASAQVYQTP